MLAKVVQRFELFESKRGEVCFVDGFDEQVLEGLIRPN